MNVQEYLIKTFDVHKYDFGEGRICTYGKVRPKIVCGDGGHISVQASDTHYCEPRIIGDGLVRYSKVELGYPSFEDERLLEYAEEPETPLETVYGWVPVELVDDIITDHGGIDFEKSVSK